MKCYYPIDSAGNRIGFKTPEACVYDASGTSLTTKLAQINSNISDTCYTKDQLDKAFSKAASNSVVPFEQGGLPSNNRSVTDAQLNYTRYGPILVLQIWGYVFSMTKYKQYECWGYLPHGWKVITPFTLDLGLNVDNSYLLSLKFSDYGDYKLPHLYTTVADITQTTEIIGTMICILG